MSTTINTTINIHCVCGHQDTVSVDLDFTEGDEIYKVGCVICHTVYGEVTLEVAQQQLAWRQTFITP